ncbi:hypothetical protein BDZ94DRAFT_1246778 [Collybia nuda]|uniref:Uncharacterized protein n=1 Tax=Collybia nuda TaxID=64659 RepID=A0A9P6CQ98_9AGAR|nr:hypothetical protein BDZ94DRAFT_1246778 [Collybia nuda]
MLCHLAHPGTMNRFICNNDQTIGPRCILATAATPFLPSPSGSTALVFATRSHHVPTGCQIIANSQFWPLVFAVIFVRFSSSTF